MNETFKDCERLRQLPEFINLNLNSAIDPCVLTPVGNEAFIYLVLPVRINA